MVIKTTPFAPLAPYKDVAAASFKISIFSMSFGFRKPNELCASPAPPLPCASVIGSTGTPSKTYKGCVPPSIELTPLIETPIPPPGSELSLTTTPAAWPCIKFSIEFVLFFSICSELICDMEPERSFLLTSK